MNQKNKFVKTRHPSSISIQQLFFICCFVGNWYVYPLGALFPLIQDLVYPLATFLGFLLVPLMLKQQDETIWEWVERSCGHRFRTSRFWLGLKTMALFMLLPLACDILTLQGSIYIVSHSIGYYFLFIPSLAYLILVQSFVEEWLFRRPLLRDNLKDKKEILFSIILFVFWHVNNPGVLSQGVIFFFMTLMSLEFYIPVVIANVLEYSWGMHFIWNFISCMEGGVWAAVKIVYTRSSFTTFLFTHPIIKCLWFSLAGFFAIKDSPQINSLLKTQHIKSGELNENEPSGSNKTVKGSKVMITRNAQDQIKGNFTGWMPLLGF